MATRITAYRAHDGTIFTSQKEADAYDVAAARKGQVEDFLAERFHEADIECLHDSGTISFILENADELINALTVQKRRGRPRKTEPEASELAAA